MKVQNEQHRVSRAGFSLLEVMIIVMIVGMLVVLAMPSWQRARETARKSMCQDNLRILNSSAAQYLFEYPQTTSLNPANLSDYLMRGDVPECPSGGVYSFRSNPYLVPICSLEDSLDHEME